MDLVLNIFAYAAVLFAAWLLSWRFPGGSLAAIVLVLLAGSFYWLNTGVQQEPFLWLKLYSLMFAFMWCAGIRSTALGDKPWACAAIMLILWGNIAEAVVEDILTGHFINVIAGILLIVSSWPQNLYAAVRLAGPHREMLWPVSRTWIVAYTAWNLAFVFAHFNADFATGGLLVLGTALAVGLIDPARWLFARATILLMHMFFLFTPNNLLLALRWDGWNQPQWHIPAQLLALAIGVVALLQAMHSRSLLASFGDRGR